MARKDKNIEIIENEKMVNGVLVSELTLKDEVIGTVKHDGDRYLAILPSGEESKINSSAEAVAHLLREYHLHRG